MRFNWKYFHHARLCCDDFTFRRTRDFRVTIISPWPSLHTWVGRDLSLQVQLVTMFKWLLVLSWWLCSDSDCCSVGDYMGLRFFFSGFGIQDGYLVMFRTFDPDIFYLVRDYTTVNHGTWFHCMLNLVLNLWSCDIHIIQQIYTAVIQRIVQLLCWTFELMSLHLAS